MATIVTGEQYMEIDGKVYEIKRQLRQKGGYPHDPVRLSHALQAIVEGRFEAVGDLPQLSAFQILLSACQQVTVDPDFNEWNFPLEPVSSDEDEWEVYEHHFLEAVNGEEAFRRLEEMGYRLCGPRRAMGFIAAQQDIQMGHPLIVTTCWQDRGDAWSVPVFRRNGSWPVLFFRYLDDGFYPHDGWLVLRRKAAEAGK